ncbi:Mannose-specific lectin 2 [Platanthera zijinensis]|uniref:Mannose-specific lectin 2 n=1 Tax=Platanthera zijinensis TaxID=2320716 RepID=A0AAP0FYH0_9ASPA
MAVPSGIAALLISSFLLLFFLSSPSSANEGNILVTGDVLASDSELSVDNAAFVMQSDCNLVLYKEGRGFQSNTSGSSTKCSLTLSDYGQLIIRDYQGSFIWSSKTRKHPQGQYAAVLQPDGEVGIYGPAVWSTPLLFSNEVKTAGVDVKSAAGVDEKISAAAGNSAPNLLLSSGVLNVGSKLASRDYALEVTKECGLRLTKSAHNNTVVWESPISSYSSSAAGENCFARLNFHGQLSILDDNYGQLWSTAAAAGEGKYVLAVKINGQATIYGPCIWTTAAE